MLCAGYIVPHPPILLPQIGKEALQQLSQTAAAYDKIAREISEYQPETIVIISAKAIGYSDYIHISPNAHAAGNFGKYNHPEYAISVDYDEELRERICALAKRNRIPAGTRGDDAPVLDTGTMVPLFFINQYFGNYKVVRISMSQLSCEQHDRLGQCITAAAEDIERNIVVIASGELSQRLHHDSPYGYAKEAAVFDQVILQAIQDNDLDTLAHINPDLIEKSAQRGLPALQILKGAIGDSLFRSSLYSYEAPFGIGYAVAAFHNKDQNPYTSLARSAMLTYLADGKLLSPSKEAAALLQQRGGVIISLYLNHKLYSCAGTIHPLYPDVAAEIIHNSVAAAFHDPHAPALNKMQIMRCEIVVYVLQDFEPIFFIEDMDVKHDGLIVNSAQKQGIIFPDQAKIHTPTQQLEAALKKADIDKDEYYTMERFTLKRY